MMRYQALILGTLIMSAGLSAAAPDLHTDILKGREKAVLGQLRTSPGLIESRDSVGSTPLHTAARMKDPAMVRLLLKAGADIQARTYAGFTPLDAATRSGASAAAEALKAAGARPSPAPISGLNGKPRGKTDDDLNGLMLDVEQLIGADRGYEAFELLSPLYRDHADQPDVVALFGHAAYARGKYAHAVLAFQAVLETHPDNHRIRLELARAYDASGQSSRAAGEYQMVLSHNPPPAVAERIQKAHAATLRQPHRISWSGRLDAGGFYDDNVNFGPASDLITITPITFFDTIVVDRFEVDADGRPESEGGAHLAANLQGFTDPGISGSWYAFGGADYYQSWLGSGAEDFESSAVSASLGAQHSGRRNSVMLPLRFSHLQLGNAPLVNLYTIEPSWGFRLHPDWHVLATGTAEYRDYDEIDDRDGTYLGYREALTWSPQGRDYSLSFSGKIYNEGAENKAFEALGWGLGISARYTFLDTAQAYASWSYTEEDYDEKEILAPEKREDDVQEGSFGVTTSFGKRWGMDMNIQYTDNESTFDLYEYERTRTTLSIFRFF